MKKNFAAYILFFISIYSFAQQPNKILNKFSLTFSSGLQYNFNANMGYPVHREGKYILPRIVDNGKTVIFDQKNPVGTYFSFTLNYAHSKKHSWEFQFTHTSNWGKHYMAVINNPNSNIGQYSMIIFFTDVRLRNINHFYHLNYQYTPERKLPSLSFGFFILNPHYQKVIMKRAYFEVRNESGFRNFELLSWGFFGGVKQLIAISRYISLGVQAGIYYSVSHHRPENFYLNPFLMYKL